MYIEYITLNLYSGTEGWWDWGLEQVYGEWGTEYEPLRHMGGGGWLPGP